MIQLHHDYLLFETASGESIPCSAEKLVVELVGDYASAIDPVLLQQASAAVLHYFKHDLQRDQVTIAEFSSVLERVLRHFGISVSAVEAEPGDPTEPSDLQQLVSSTEAGFELAFFCRLRAELHSRLTKAPRVVTFCGLRGCVKQLAGAKRWCPRCQTLNDQIVDYLRNCLSREQHATACELVIR